MYVCRARIGSLSSLRMRHVCVMSVNLECEQELIPYYRRFGFVERSWQGYGNQFVKLDIRYGVKMISKTSLTSLETNEQSFSLCQHTYSFYVQYFI